jgi:hypothetical protein
VDAEAAQIVICIGLVLLMKGHMTLYYHIGGNGDMDDLISISPPHVKSLVIYQTTFAVVSFCGSISLHIDYHGEFHGEMWTAILPLILVENSAPELVIKQVHSAELQQLKLNLNTAVVFGPRTFYATNSVKYRDAFHVCLLLSFGFIHKENIDITTNYPSKTDRNDAIYGLTWMKMFNRFASFKKYLNVFLWMILLISLNHYIGGYLSNVSIF